MPPGPETDAKVAALFRTTPFDAAEEAALTEAIEAARAVSARHLPTVRPRMASKKAAQLKAVAGPGPSG